MKNIHLRVLIPLVVVGTLTDSNEVSAEEIYKLIGSNGEISFTDVKPRSKKTEVISIIRQASLRRGKPKAPKQSKPVAPPGYDAKERAFSVDVDEKPLSTEEQFWKESRFFYGDVEREYSEGMN